MRSFPYLHFKCTVWCICTSNRRKLARSAESHLKPCLPASLYPSLSLISSTILSSVGNPLAGFSDYMKSSSSPSVLLFFPPEYIRFFKSSSQFKLHFHKSHTLLTLRQHIRLIPPSTITQSTIHNASLSRYEFQGSVTATSRRPRRR